MNCRILLISLLVISGLSSCRFDGSEKRETKDWESVALGYAKEFSLKKRGDSTRLTVYMDESHTESVSQSFTLVNRASEKSGNSGVIQVPCKRIVCISSTQLAYFFALDDIQNIVGINSSRYLFNEEMNERVNSGKVMRLGKEGNFSLEIIASLDPDVIFVSPFKRGGYDALRNLGIPLVPMAAYNEKTPLGRAEWIKMMSLFVGKTADADSIFKCIEKRYLELKALTADVNHRPKIFSGKLRSGSWYLPGGDSFYAHYFRDAGGEYVIKNDDQGAYPVDFETIYRKAVHADFWRVVTPEKPGISLEEFLSQDHRYADFKAAKDGNIILCNIREKPFYEQAAVKPEVLLADYIHFLHPGLLTDYKPFFYEKLK
ncbi:ABC transporter substrate-binding protein [Marinilabilia rubra]|uniref:Iron ABC transporter substrate-binding protein n=1 Tax=Marinilabilia rubra TaxID=2162893 RepID=A0A2U2B5V7_9BACT|nr:ABC transporter substrate-binding protein [Marinilabilia rubra]PWD98422.1 iron ABC transporter substrate-binding protein [Marinilabilia rubra]